MPLMLKTPIVVPNWGTADRLEVVRFHYDKTEDMTRVMIDYRLADKERTFYGPGTKSETINIQDLPAMLAEHTDVAGAFQEASAGLVTGAAAAAAKLGVKIGGKAVEA